MFDYLINKHKLKIQLGQYISHKVVQKKEKEGSVKTILRTPEELNALDRYELARDFYENVVYDHYLEGGIPKLDMIDDIAIYIDKRIPQSYEKWYLRRGDTKPCNLSIDPSRHGLIYFLKHNE